MKTPPEPVSRIGGNYRLHMPAQPTSRVPAKKEEIPGDRSPARDFLSNRTNPTNL